MIGCVGLPRGWGMVARLDPFLPFHTRTAQTLHVRIPVASVVHTLPWERELELGASYCRPMRNRCCINYGIPKQLDGAATPHSITFNLFGVSPFALGAASDLPPRALLRYKEVIDIEPRCLMLFPRSFCPDRGTHYPRVPVAPFKR